MTRIIRLPVMGAILLALVACGGPGGALPSSPASAAETSTPAAAMATADATASPAPTRSPAATLGTTPSPSRSPIADEDRLAVPSRVVIPALNIDLPVLSGDTVVEGNPPDYPLCGVAQYLTTYRYPGRVDTTTWVYAHARDGMFLPLLDASLDDDGADLVGEEVLLYSTEPRLYRYRIDTVRPHSLTRAIAREVPAGARRLVLQTSEGPRGTVPKLQVGALLESSEPVDGPDAMPSASPEVCYLP